MQDNNLRPSTSSKLIPAYMDKDGNLSSKKSSSLTKEEFSRLQDFVNKTIKDISNEILNGMIELNVGNVLIITIPTIKEGGSASTDLELIKTIYEEGFKEWGDNKQIDKVAAVGTVSHAVANKLNIPIDIQFATAPSTASAARKGLNVMALSVGNMTKSFIKAVEAEDIKYNVIDGKV